jgi:hypothetical protein
MYINLHTWTRSDILRSRSVAKLRSRSEKYGALALALRPQTQKIMRSLCAQDFF